MQAGVGGNIQHTDPCRAVEACSSIDTLEPLIQDVHNVEVDCNGPNTGSESNLDSKDCPY